MFKANWSGRSDTKRQEPSRISSPGAPVPCSSTPRRPRRPPRWRRTFWRANWEGIRAGSTGNWRHSEVCATSLTAVYEPHIMTIEPCLLPPGEGGRRPDEGQRSSSHHTRQAMRPDQNSAKPQQLRAEGRHSCLPALQSSQVARRGMSATHPAASSKLDHRHESKRVREYEIRFGPSSSG